MSEGLWGGLTEAHSNSIQSYPDHSQSSQFASVHLTTTLPYTHTLLKAPTFRGYKPGSSSQYPETTIKLGPKKPTFLYTTALFSTN
jgi:hypothetical protein